MKIKELIRESKSIEKQIEYLQAQLFECKEKIQKYFDEHKEIDKIEIEPISEGDPLLIAQKSERVYINYMVEKLKEKLDKELFNEVTIKNYTVTDITGLINMLKSNGINPKEFKKFINMNISVNRDALKQLYEIGDITKKDLKGCYTAEIRKSIQIKEKRVI